MRQFDPFWFVGGPRGVWQESNVLIVPRMFRKLQRVDAYEIKRILVKIFMFPGSLIYREDPPNLGS